MIMLLLMVLHDVAIELLLALSLVIVYFGEENNCMPSRDGLGLCVTGQFQRYSCYIFQFLYFHRATIKHLVDQSNKFKA